MRGHTTALLAALVLVLGGVYYFYEVRGAPAREEAKARKGRVFTADVKDVTELELRRPGQEAVRLVKEGEAWQMATPVKARGNRGTVDETLATIMTARIDREIEASPSAMADYGLDKPAADVTLKLKDGKTLGLELGAKSPTGVWVYARAKDKPAVLMLPDAVLRDTTRPVADFRDRTIVAYDVKDVTGLEVVTPDTALAAEAGADGKWTLTRPVALPADRQTVSDLLDKLASLKVKDFVAESPRSLQPYGLERPTRLTIHTGRDKERASRGLLVGRTDAAKQGVYAMRPGETSVLLLPEELAKLLPRTVAMLRDKVLVDVERDKLARVEVESAKGAVTVVRENNEWKITAPEALPADAVEVGAILLKLRELRAQGFLTDDAAGIPRYLARPDVKVTLVQEGADAPATTVLLATSRESRGGKPSAYAAVAGKGPVVLVDGAAVEELARGVNDLRDKRLLGAVEPKDIRRLRVRSGAQTAVLESKRETDWRLVEPTKGAARSDKVTDFLYTLRALKWKEIVAPGGEDPAKYGLDAPAMEIALFRADGSEIGAVLVGKREGDRTFVKTRAGPAIYAVDTRQLGEPPKIPDDFKS